MDLQSFGRNLVELLAERSLETLRSTNMSDVRSLMNGRLPAALTPGASSSSSSMGAFGIGLGALAVGAALGAGLTALYTPTTGDELRKKLGRGARDARTQAMHLGDDVRSKLDDARTTIVHGVEQVGTAVGLAAPATAKAGLRKAKAHAMNGHAPARSRGKKTAAARAHHDA